MSKNKKRVTIPPTGLAVPVHTLDGLAVSARLTSSTTAGGVCEAIATHYGLDYLSHYSLYEVHDSRWHVIEDKSPMSKVLEGWTTGDLESGIKKLYFKRRISVPGSDLQKAEDAASSDSPVLRISFYEALYFFRFGVYRFSSDVVSRLAALALQAVRGDHDGSSVEEFISELVPNYAVQGGSSVSDKFKVSVTPDAPDASTLAEDISSAWSGLAGTDTTSAEQQFLETVKPAAGYGADIFFGKRTWKDAGERSKGNEEVKNRTEDVTVAVSHNGIHLLSMERALHYESHEYENITKWTVSRDGKIFAFSVDEDVIVYLVTEQAGAIEKSVEVYVQFLVAIRSGTEVPKKTDIAGVPEVETSDAGEELPFAAGGGAAGGGGGGDAEDEASEADGGLPAGWVALQDEDGDTYYMNEATGETSWEPPSAGASDAAAGGLLAGWTAMQDEDGDTYYVNDETGETQWEPPTADGEEASEAAGDLPAGWTAMQDEDGDTYYINDETGETQWEPPTE